MLLNINNLYTKSTDEEQKAILKGLNLAINPGEIHVIMGPNGSGKSTLANTIFHSPKYEITSGNIYFDGNDITNSNPTDIAKLGIFMSFQNPVTIPGITNANFLTSLIKTNINKDISIFDAQKMIKEQMNKLAIDSSFLSREFNVGFSGGEKKKNEILQLMLLNPKLAILDETDSGLDVDAIKTVSNGINLFHNEQNSVLIITHSNKILEDLKVDKVHILVDGKIIKSGDAALALEIEKEGYQKYNHENND
ncbi:MAG: Fe-S cluster assembly ATPase SufC [Bacilli bacterium]|nr:Fe-S cluster assembly ATPase SufC [Bacilli bacterium]